MNFSNDPRILLRVKTATNDKVDLAQRQMDLGEQF